MADKSNGTKVEVDGIELAISVDPANDYELVECSSIATDPSSSVQEQNLAYIRRNHIILGDDYDRVMSELRSANGGELPVRVVMDFVARAVSKAVEEKN